MLPRGSGGAAAGRRAGHGLASGGGRRPSLRRAFGAARFPPSGLRGAGQPYWLCCAWCLTVVLGKRGGCREEPLSLRWSQGLRDPRWFKCRSGLLKALCSLLRLLVATPVPAAWEPSRTRCAGPARRNSGRTGRSAGWRRSPVRAVEVTRTRRGGPDLGPRPGPRPLVTGEGSAIPGGY